MLASEVLEKTYLELKGDLPEICFLNPSYAEIASNGSEKGYIVYKLCFILNESWVVSFGRMCGKYSAKKYDCDIAAIPIDQNKDITQILQGNKYFFYSPVFTYSSGEFAVRAGSFFASEMIGIVTKLGRFEVKKGNYSKEIVEHLGDKIREILS
ncbi:MAG: hypothetical protein GX625_17420 [Clostridiaceae bacterium]|jgi:hypothetical protein|nr:hypothetical protein [Clostridiaceae bacterium]